MSQKEIDCLLHNLEQSFNGADMRGDNPAVAYGYLKQGVMSVLEAAKGNKQYKFLRIIK